MPSIDRAAVVQEARAWLRTPYRHQHMKKGQAVDCVGLVMGTGLNLGLLVIDREEFRPFSRYARTPNPRLMGQAMERWMLFVGAAKDLRELPPDGSVAWMGWREHMPMHLGILATADDGRRTLIHAWEHAGKVVEHGLVDPWPGRIVSWWDYPNLQG